MAAVTRLLREPFVHFLVAGALIFAAYAALRQSEPGGDVIVVDRAALLNFMRRESNRFDTDGLAAALDDMPQDALQALIDAYVDEETLFREAASLGLADGDYVVRQRLIQKMRFLLEDIAETELNIDERSLMEYYRAHRENYAIEPSITFTHVFFDAERRGSDAALEAATEALRSLNEAGAGFVDAPAWGDGFPLLRNYVERRLDYVAGHFGDDFASGIAALSPSRDVWQGPLQSVFGQHVVLVTEHRQGRHAEFESVRGAVERDFRRDRLRASVDEAIGDMRGRYRIELGKLRPTVPQ